jgi:hypothetical protein
MKKVKFVEVSMDRSGVDVWNVFEREGESVSEMFEEFYEEVVGKVKEELLEGGCSVEEVEGQISEFFVKEGNGFSYWEEGCYIMVEEGSKFWDVENWLDWSEEKLKEFVGW